MSYNATINVDYYLCNSIFITAWIYSVQYYTLAKKKKKSVPESFPVNLLWAIISLSGIFTFGQL